MKTFWIILSLATALCCRAQNSKELLADALFAEEAEGKIQEAAEAYEKLLQTYEAERKIAATALFRLAEIRGEEKNQAEEIRLLKKFLIEFQGVEPQQKRATERLGVLGEDLPIVGKNAINEEKAAIEALQERLKTSPDLGVGKEQMHEAVDRSWTDYLKFAHEVQGIEALNGALGRAVLNGNLTLTKFLIESGMDPNAEKGLSLAIIKGYDQISGFLQGKGATLAKADPTFLVDQYKIVTGKNGYRRKSPQELLRIIKLGIAAGAPVNEVLPQQNSSSESLGKLRQHETVLLNAVRRGHVEIVDLLIENNADPNLRENEDGYSPLHLAAVGYSLPILEALLQAGADPHYQAVFTDSSPRQAPSPIPGPGNRGSVKPKDQFKISVWRANTENESIALELLNQGVKIPEKALPYAAKNGHAKLVKALIEKRVDMEARLVSRNSAGTALLWALREGHNKIAETLRDHGATVGERHWFRLSEEQVLQWNREFYYPIWAERNDVTFILPEFPSLGADDPDSEASYPGRNSGFMGRFQPGDLHWHNRLLLSYPSSVRQVGQDNNSAAPMPENLTWHLIREGQSIPLDILNEPLPDFQGGDLIEAVGFLKNETATIQNSSALFNLRDNRFKDALLQGIRIPIIIQIGSDQHELEIRGDRLIYQPHLKQIPYFKNLEQLFKMTGIVHPKGEWAKRVAIRRKKFPEIRVPVEPDEFIKLQAGDIVEITGDDLRKGQLEGLEPDRRKSFISAKVDGLLCGWRWGPTSSPLNRPTLLQAIGELHRGLTPSEDLDPSAPLAWLRTPNQSLASIPAVDLSQIKIHRLSGEMIEINLKEKIEDWDQADRTQAPFDLELMGGDMLELIPLSEPKVTYTKKESAFLTKAISRTITVKNRRGEVKVRNLAFQLPEWVHHEQTLLRPIGTLGVGAQARKSTNEVSANSVLRDGTVYPFERRERESYFPKEGDLLFRIKEQQEEGRRRRRTQIGQ